MCEFRYAPFEPFENLDLDGRVHHVILATYDMGDGEIYVVDHRGKSVEITSIPANQQRIRQCGRVDMLWSADQVVPSDHAMSQFEPPMRRAPLSLESFALIWAK